MNRFGSERSGGGNQRKHFTDSRLRARISEDLALMSREP